MKTEKILYVITKSNWGGAQAYVYTLATQAVLRGASVVVALGGTGEKGAVSGELAHRLTNSGIRILFVPELVRDISFVNDIRAYVKLLRIIKKERPTIVHVNSSKAGGISALAGRIAGKTRIIFTIHGLPHQEQRQLLSRTLIWLASWVTILLSTKTVVLSKQQLASAPALFVRKKSLVCIPNGIATYKPLPQAQARNSVITKKPALARYHKWIISTGELTHNKGIDVLINAFVPIYHLFDDVALILFNDGKEREALEALARQLGIIDRVFFIGFTSDVHLLLSVGDIFVLPSRKEGLPFALLEAGMATLPIITTNVGGIPELISANESGILIAPDDTEALSNAMIDLLKNTNKGDALGKTLRACVQKKFSSQEMIDKTFTLYTADKE